MAAFVHAYLDSFQYFQLLPFCPDVRPDPVNLCLLGIYVEGLRAAFSEGSLHWRNEEVAMVSETDSAESKGHCSVCARLDRSPFPVERKLAVIMIIEQKHRHKEKTGAKIAKNS